MNSVLAFGNFRRNERIDVSVLAQEAALEICFAEDPQEAAEWLEHNTPRVVLVHDSSENAARVCEVARSKLERAAVPIISVARELDDLIFQEVFSWGGDDAVGLNSLRPLLSRIRALPIDPKFSPPAPRGRAVVADPVRSRRLVRAHVLRNAGYTVNFAVSKEDAIARCSDADLVILDSDLDDGLTLVDECSELHPQTRFVVLCAPRQIAISSQRFAARSNVAVADSFAPPENVLFIVNDLARGGFSDQRSSRRLLYGTKVAFRPEGRDEDEVGFSYNISADGLYVRTLAPPPSEYVWLELQPPRSDRRVRMEGRVAWRRPFGPSYHATVPPGFGVQISDATRRNLDAWQTAYADFCKSLGFTPMLPPR